MTAGTPTADETHTVSQAVSKELSIACILDNLASSTVDRSRDGAITGCRDCSMLSRVYGLPQGLVSQRYHRVWQCKRLTPIELNSADMLRT